jgi:hypothetical protein
MIKAAGMACIVMVIAIVTTAHAAESVSHLEVLKPTQAIANAHNPPCGAISELSRVVRNPAFQKAVGKLFGAEAGAGAVIVGEASQVADKSGGDIAKFFRAGQGNGNFSNCAVICAKTPRKTWVRAITLSNDKGENYVRIGPNGTRLNETGSYSAWTNVVSARNAAGVNTVCAEAKNWSHNQTASMKLTLDYVKSNPGGSCSRYSKFEGTATQSSNAPWVSTMDLRAGTFSGKNNTPTGKVNGTIKAATCFSDEFLVTTHNSTGQTSNCYGSLGKDGTVSGWCATGGAGSKWEGKLTK